MLGAGKRLLGVFPHPDDEAYAAAGLLALCARAGAEVTVVCATRGEAGQRPPGLRRPLSEVRTEELAASCRALGAAPPVLLDLPDGALDQLAPERAAPVIADAIRATAPDAVVTLGTDGAYGHRDHLACTRLVKRACASVDPAPRLLCCAFPPRVFAPVWRALRRLPRVLDPAVRETDLGADWDRAELRVRVAPVRDAKIAAVAAHASQLPDGDPMRFLRPGVLEALVDEERYSVAAGPPLPVGATDPFA